jgi:hypothetical protein
LVKRIKASRKPTTGAEASPKHLSRSSELTIDNKLTNKSAQVPIWIGKVWMIEKIEDFGPELQAEPFGKGEPAAQRKIHLSERKASQCVATESALTVLRSNDEGSRVDSLFARD